MKYSYLKLELLQLISLIRFDYQLIVRTTPWILQIDIKHQVLYSSSIEGDVKTAM